MPACERLATAVSRLPALNPTWRSAHAHMALTSRRYERSPPKRTLHTEQLARRRHEGPIARGNHICQRNRRTVGLLPPMWKTIGLTAWRDAGCTVG
jgi:hypothetical protein